MNLQESIYNLYKVFAPYIILGSIKERSCDCCVPRFDIDGLFSKELKDLTEIQLGFYIRKAITTIGDINDYKHFLPRILELMIDFDVLDDFLIFEKLNYANWKSWREEEVLAIENFFTGLLYHNLKLEDISDSELHDIISLCIKYLGVDKTLKIWKANLSDNHLRLFVEYKLDTKCLIFEEMDLQTFDNWLASSIILNKIEELFLKKEDKIEANRISIAYTMLENGRGK